MRCSVCDRELAADEVKFDRRLRGKFEMCGTCLSVVKDCFEADSEEEIEESLNTATVDTLYGSHEDLAGDWRYT